MRILKAGLIGSHIQKTRLPAALEILCAEAGMALEFELIDTDGRTGFDFVSTVEDLKSRGWTGVSVTHPHKTEAATYAGDSLLPEIAGIGASNALIFGPPASAHNTDYTGFVSAWRTIMGDETPGAVAMAGAGGVARALAFALLELGASRLSVWDVEAGKAEALVRDCGKPARVVSRKDAMNAAHAADGLVNATALGMEHARGMAFTTRSIGPQRWAFDAVYTPTNTMFLKRCRSMHLECLTGFDLFRHMAIGTFEAYTGITPDKDKSLEALLPLAPD